MRKTALVCALGIVGAAGVSPAVAAPVQYPVHVIAHTSFLLPESHFEAMGIPECESGTVVDGPSRVREMRWGGVFVGLKVFTCDGDESGFTVRLNARFGEAGSTGTWTLVDAWGDLEGVKASGSLVGFPADDGITDVYTGMAR